MSRQIHLTDLGYNDFFASAQKDLQLTQETVARVIAEYRGAYRVKGSNGEYLAKITGKQMFTAKGREDYPAVGDWVVIETLAGEKNAVIREILPRKTILKKKYSNTDNYQIIATNIDIAFVVASMDRDYNLNRFERYLVLVNDGGIQPVIILNKIDLITEIELSTRITEIKNRFSGVDIILTNAISDKGQDELAKYIKRGKTYCFLGSSGVGKSTLINKLLEVEEIKTRKINLTIERGRHTTTARVMYFMENGGILIDNPGTREVGIADADTGLGNIFSEIESMSTKCKFSNCTHTHEPDCAIVEAIEKGQLNKDKYENYHRLKRESRFYKMTKVEKKAKDRKFGQFIKKVLEQRKDA